MGPGIKEPKLAPMAALSNIVAAIIGKVPSLKKDDKADI
jgi:hypothetical protein